MFNKFSKVLFRYPFQIFAIILMLSSLFFWTAFISPKHLVVDFSLEQMFPEDDPEKDVYDLFLSEFSREDDKMLLVYNCNNPLSRKNIALVSQLTESLELDVDGVEAVISLGNIEDGEYFSDDLSDLEWSNKIVKLLEHPIYTNLIISNDKKTGAILIDLKDDVIDQSSRKLILDQLYDIVSTVDWDWYEAGIPVLRTRYIEFMNYERSIFIPISFLVAAAILFLIFRQIKIILIALFALINSLIWVAGIMALLDISINVVSYLTFNLIMIIGASNTIHLLMKYHEGLANGLDKRNALIRVVERIGAALFLTSFTTAVGFCSLVFTNIRITQEFGLLVGFGVILMFLLVITIMPILLSIIPKPADIHINRLIRSDNSHLADKIGAFNNKYPKQILIISLSFLILSLIGLFKMDYNATVLEDLRPGNPIYDDMSYVEEKLGGMLTFEIIIDSKDELSGLDPVFMNQVQKFKHFILQFPEINVAITPGDYLMLANEKWGSGVRKLPNTLDEAFSYSLDFDQVNNLFNDDYSKTRISCRISNITYERGMDIRGQLLSGGKSIFSNESSIVVTGSTLMALSTNRHLLKNLTTSFLIAFFIIFLSIVILFRSFTLSLLSVLPNIIPLMLAGGLMGYIGIKLRPSTAMTFSIALGIAVDNTIHFLARFRQEYNKNYKLDKSVFKSILTTGRAIISTGIILSLGFFVLIFSEFVPNHEFGLLATIIIIASIGGSLVLLPVLILFIKPKLNLIKSSNMEKY